MREQGSSYSHRPEDGMGRELQGFVLATKELRDACKDLYPGQMVCLPELTLMDSMAALQIMDPRMDSGIFPIPEHLVADCDRIPSDTQVLPFDATEPLTATDICWIMDRLCACELAWHRGASLAQTIYTCMYVHSLASIHPKAPLTPGRHRNRLVSLILRPFLIAVLKSVGLVWDELSKGNLIEGEDFNGDKAGVSLLEEVDPSVAVNLMQEAIDLVEGVLNGPPYRAEGIDSSLMSEEEARALLARLRLRKSFLECFYTFAKVDPTLRFGQGLDPMQAIELLPDLLETARTSLSELEGDGDSALEGKMLLRPPSFADSPSNRATSAFDPWFSRRPSFINEYNAPSAPPPPVPLQLRPPSETVASLRNLIRGFAEAKSLVNQDACWTKWKSFADSKALFFEREQTMPYIRSLWQSFICSDGIVALRMPLDWLSDSFFVQIGNFHPRNVLLVVSNLSPTVQGSSTSTTAMSLCRRIEHYLERLNSQLVNHLSSLCQNRSRGKRRLASSYETLLELSMEAAAIDSNLGDRAGKQLPPQARFAPATQLLTLDVMLQTVFSGFELQLHRVEESSASYWIAQRIAEEKVEVLKSLLGDIESQGAAEYLRPKLQSTEAIVDACRAMQSLYETMPMVLRPSLPWDLLQEDEIAIPSSRNGEGSRSGSEPSVNSFDSPIGKASFCKRFKWLRGRGRPEGVQTLDKLWLAYVSTRKALHAKTTRQRLDDAIAHLQTSLLLMTSVDEQSNETDLLLTGALRNILDACLLDGQPTSLHSLIPLTFSPSALHPWFPVPITGPQPDQ